MSKHGTHTPLVGVFMPCYNYGEYIQEALDSLFKQTFQDFELIIADDASPDPKTIKTLKNLKLPKGTIYFEKKNMGLNNIRNKYMARFKTKYIISFDADDVLDPKFLEKCVDYLEKHPKKASVAVWLQLFGTQEGIVKFDEKKTGFPDMLVSNNYLGSCLMRKAVFDDIGGYDSSKEVDGAEDYDFWLTAIERGWSLGVLPEALFHYRRTDTSLSARSAMPEMALFWRKKIIEKHIESYRTYLAETLLGFELRASNAHAGYIETNARYKHMQQYVDNELLPKIMKQGEEIEKLKKESVHHYIGVAKTTIKKSLRRK